MEKHENNQLRETTADVIAHELADERNDPAFVEEYLKAGFLSSAIDALFYARRQANLTQAQVAERLNTKQASIARLEADTSGSLTLRRYVEFALACGMVPLDITLAPIDSVRDFVRSHPDSPLTQELYQAWMEAKSEVQRAFFIDSGETITVQTVRNLAPPSNSTTSPNEAKQVVEAAEQFLKDCRKASGVSSQLPVENVMTRLALPASNPYQQKVGQPASTVNQAKEMGMAA